MNRLLVTKTLRKKFLPLVHAMKPTTIGLQVVLLSDCGQKDMTLSH